MPPPLDDILASIQDGSLLSADPLSRLDHDAILDARDGDDFESEWLRVNNDIERRWLESSADPVAEAKIEAVRRESFMSVSNATSQHDCLIRGRRFRHHCSFSGPRL